MTRAGGLTVSDAPVRASQGILVSRAYPGAVVFDVGTDSYARFMGRFSEPLAVQFAQLAGVRAGQRVPDVGSGPSALTEQLVQRLGSGAVSAIDPSASFIAATRGRFPQAGVVRGVAEQLPFADRAFDAALAQLVVHFMDDAARARGNGRVTRPGGTAPPACGITRALPVPSPRSGEQCTTLTLARVMNQR